MGPTRCSTSATASSSASAPSCRRRAAWARSIEHVAGGWQLNGIVQKQTGFPLAVIDSRQLDIRFLTNRPDATCDPNDGAPHTIDQWFNTSCFVPRPLAQTGDRPGNAGRNTIRGPGFASTDLSLFKNIELGGAQRLQLRLEAFNLFNQVRFNNPGGPRSARANFGRITVGAGRPRHAAGG